MSETNAKVKDPVCGMMIDPANAVGSSRHEEVLYYFCSRGCETKFDAEPERFAGGDAADPRAMDDQRHGSH